MLRDSTNAGRSQFGAVRAPRYLYPEPRVRAGLLLGRNRAATACMDLSDGLADGVRQIAEASGVGMTIDARRMPVDPAARAMVRIAPASIRSWRALAGGDDYELLFTASPKLRGRLRDGRAPRRSRRSRASASARRSRRSMLARGSRRPAAARRCPRGSVTFDDSSHDVARPPLARRAAARQRHARANGRRLCARLLHRVLAVSRASHGHRASRSRSSST